MSEICCAHCGGNHYEVTTTINEGGDVDFTNLTPEDCQLIFQCIIDNGTTEQFTEFVNAIDWRTLTAEHCDEILACIINSNNQTLLVEFLQLLDFSELTTAQVDVIQAVLGPLFTVNAGTTADAADGALGEETVTFGDIVHFWSPDGSILFGVTAGSAVVAASLNPTVLAGIAHTAVTDIDLRPALDGNGDFIDNTFTVEITWTDENGVAQTTTDPTPITITGGSCAAVPLTLPVIDNATVGTALEAEFQSTSPAFNNNTGGLPFDAFEALDEGDIWLLTEVDLDALEAGATPSGNLDLVDDITDPNEANTIDGVFKWAWVAGPATLEWTTTNEGYIRAEYQDCGEGNWLVLGDAWNADPVAYPGASDTLTVNVPAGMHRIRVATADVAGGANAWTLASNPIPQFFSGQPVSEQVVWRQCNGTFTTTEAGGTPVVPLLTGDPLRCAFDIEQATPTPIPDKVSYRRISTNMAPVFGRTEGLDDVVYICTHSSVPDSTLTLPAAPFDEDDPSDGPIDRFEFINRSPGDLDMSVVAGPGMTYVGPAVVPKDCKLTVSYDNEDPIVYGHIECSEIPYSESNPAPDFNTPSKICLEPAGIPTGNGGIAAGEPSPQAADAFLMYTEEPAQTRFSNIAGGEVPNAVPVYFDGADWYHCDNTINPSPVPGGWPTFVPVATDFLFASVTVGNPGLGGSVFNGPLAAGSTGGIPHVENLAGLDSVQGNTYANGAANDGEFYITGEFQIGEPQVANLRLDGLYELADGSTITVEEAIAAGWTTCPDGTGDGGTDDQDATEVNVIDTGDNFTGTTVEAVLAELATRISGIAHTAITGIDLQAGVNPNEYLVVITWTDEDGNVQTTTDPTPVTISSQDFTHSGFYFTNATTLDMDQALLQRNISAGGELHLHTLNPTAFSNGNGNLYNTIIDGVLTQGLTAPHTVPAGTEVIVTPQDGIGVTLSYVTSAGAFPIDGSNVECDVVTVEPLTAAAGTLADGTTYTVANAEIFDSAGDGDIRFDQGDGLLTIDFSAPVDLLVSPTDEGDVNNPIIWQDPQNGEITEIVTDGPASYTPGTVDAALIVSGSTVTATLDNPAVRSSDDWGLVEFTGVTTATVQARDAEAMRFRARTTSTENVCDLIAGLGGGGVAQGGAMTVISTN